MSQSLTMTVVSFALALVLGYPFVALLRRYRLGKQVRIEGPATHLVKVGTPTLGGLLFVGVTVFVTLASNFVGRYSIALPLGVLVACALLGAVDDRLTLVGKGDEGISARTKFALLTLIALAASYVLVVVLGIDYVFFPSVVSRFNLGLWAIPLATLAIVGTANAVNLTDGLDSLVGMTAIVAFAAYGLIAYLQRQQYLVTFCFTLVGAVVAFLWFNAHPAQVFMGDTGSLALGATLAVVALMTGHVLLLPIIGFVFVAEALSVVLQVGYFKLTGGKRLFKMAPLHHHFELLGWSETQVALRLTLISMLAGVFGVALALL